MKNYQTISQSQLEANGVHNETGPNNEMTTLAGSPPQKAKKGISLLTAAVFIAGEMAGSGVLALPRAIVNAGWIGLILLVFFCINAGYGGMKLGACWEILEERYPQYRTKTRNPYTLIALKAVGRAGSRIVSNCIRITLFGAGTVYLMLSALIVQEIFQGLSYNASSCVYFLGIALVLTPAMWLGSPKDFRAVGLGAILTTSIACVLYFIQMMRDGQNDLTSPKHEIHGFPDFFLAFGTLLFAFGGASTFPTIQNDMEDKKSFSKSILIAFTVILLLYVPVTAAGYYVYGEDVMPNFAMSLSRTVLVDIGSTLMAIHLLFAFLIVINPVCQEIEESFKIPNRFCLKRCLVRSSIVFVMILIGEFVPEFSKILALIGGSTITLLTFVFPPYFYMRLCNQENENWEKRTIPLYEKFYIWELIVIGIGGGTAATYSAIASIFKGTFIKPCLWPF